MKGFLVTAPAVLAAGASRADEFAPSMADRGFPP